MAQQKDMTHIDDLYKAWCGAHVEISRLIKVGAGTVKLCFAGEALFEKVYPAVEHLEADPALPQELTVHLFDTMSSGIELPEAPWTGKMATCRDKQLMVNNGGFHMLFNPASRVYSVIDTEEKTAFYHGPDASMIPTFELSAPMRMIFHWWGREKGMHLIHSACAGSCGKGVLITGRGGAGKSTMALSLAMEGLEYVGDDYVFITGDPVPKALSIYNSAKINPDMIEKLQLPLGYLENVHELGTEKGLIYLNKHYRKSLVRELGISAVLIPEANGDPKRKRIPPFMAFAEMASSTIFQMPGSGSQTLSEIRSVLNGIPAFKGGRSCIKEMI